MRLKQIMTIGLSAAMILSTVSAETVVFAANEQTTKTADSTNAESGETGVLEESDIATESAEEGAEVAFEADPERSDSDNESTDDEIQIEEEQEASDEVTADEDAESDDAESAFDDNADLAAFSDESSDAADTEYGKEVYSEISEDEASSEIPANGAVIKWTIYDSGTLVVENAEGGNGLTPNRCPWFMYKKDIKNVIIDNSITALGTQNFWSCPALKTVTIRGTLSKIGNSAFEGCKELKNISVMGKANAEDRKLF